MCVCMCVCVCVCACRRGGIYPLVANVMVKVCWFVPPGLKCLELELQRENVRFHHLIYGYV